MTLTKFPLFVQLGETRASMRKATWPRQEKMKYVFVEMGGARKCHSKLAAGPVCCYFINPTALRKIKSWVTTFSNREAWYLQRAAPSDFAWIQLLAQLQTPVYGNLCEIWMLGAVTHITQRCNNLNIQRYVVITKPMTYFHKKKFQYVSCIKHYKCSKIGIQQPCPSSSEVNVACTLFVAL